MGFQAAIGEETHYEDTNRLPVGAFRSWTDMIAQLTKHEDKVVRNVQPTRNHVALVITHTHGKSENDKWRRQCLSWNDANLNFYVMKAGRTIWDHSKIILTKYSVCTCDNNWDDSNSKRGGMCNCVSNKDVA